MTRGDGAPHALVIGGSVGGLATALLLRRIGWRVDVYERSSEELSSRGAGILTHPELLAALDRGGVGSRDVGVRIAGRVTFNLDGSIAGVHDMPQITSSWDVLYQRMRGGLPDETCHAGRPLVDVEARSDGATAVFADGSRAAGDLLIGCDGVRSTVRARAAPHCRARYAGYVAWRGMVPEGAASAATRERLAGRLSFCLPPGEQFLSYPIAGEGGRLGHGDRRLNWVWYRQAVSDREFETLFTDAHGGRHDVSMPPNRIHPDVVAAMRDDARAILPPAYRELVALTDKPFLQAIYDLESEETAFGRVIVMGDAAFVARPHTGFGVTKAVGDAVALADALAAAGSDIDAGIAAWRAERLPFGQAMVARGRLLGRLLSMGRDGPERDPFGETRHVSASVMIETGISDTMRDSGRDSGRDTMRDSGRASAPAPASAPGRS